MKNAILIALAILIVATMSVLATLAAVETDRTTPPSVPVGSNGSEQASTQLPEAMTTDSSDSREEVADPAMATNLEAISAADLLPARLPTDEELEAKYRPFDGAEFVGLYRGREHFYTKLADVIVRRKIDTGQYASKIIEASESFGPILGRESWPGNLPPVDGVKVDEIEGGLLEIKHAQVFPDEDPQLYALYMEVQWLRRKAEPHME